MAEKQPKHTEETKAERMSRLIIAIVTCLGALGMAALLYFPLYYRK